jgi:hypothetical protein
MSISIRTSILLTSVMFLGAFAVGCNDACDDAGEKFEECFPSTGDEPQPNDPGTQDDTQAECSGANECRASCTSAATCADLKGAVSGEENDFTKCSAQCQ